MQIYRTGSNESVYDIAQKHGISPIKISEDNDIEIRCRLPKGKEILVLTPSRTYNVRSTDTLDSICCRFKTTKEELFRLNPELCRRERLYPGQLLTVKESTPSYGMICTNGYFYSGAGRDNLARALPFLSYVTVCSAVYKDEHIQMIFPFDEIVRQVRDCNRVPLLRIYLTELPEDSKVTNFASSISILSSSAGFSGVTLSSPISLCSDAKKLEAFVFSIRRILMENDLLLFVEGDIEQNTSYMEYADAGVLTYDKLHYKDVPSFEYGEKANFTRFADASESARAFIEMSSFAFSGGKYVEKRDAMRVIDKRHAQISYDDASKLTYASYGKHKKREVRMDSLENTKAKLELVSELGFMGISFDIGRVCVPDLMMASSMFDIITEPFMLPKNEDNARVKKCNP